MTRVALRFEHGIRPRDFDALVGISLELYEMNNDGMQSTDIISGVIHGLLCPSSNHLLSAHYQYFLFHFALSHQLDWLPLRSLTKAPPHASITKRFHLSVSHSPWFPPIGEMCHGSHCTSPGNSLKVLGNTILAMRIQNIWNSFFFSRTRERVKKNRQIVLKRQHFVLSYGLEFQRIISEFKFYSASQLKTEKQLWSIFAIAAVADYVLVCLSVVF